MPPSPLLPVPNKPCTVYVDVKYHVYLLFSVSALWSYATLNMTVALHSTF